MTLLQKLRDNRDLALVGGVLLILLILFAPIPPLFLDLFIIANLALALTVLLLTFYVGKPVEFSTFPSLLLVATLYRLSLNIAATRLILTNAHAGQIIDAIGSFVVQGNFVVGLVVFSILVVVQFVVVTAGAQRVSEVAARFTLDSMPGQQMSIDADLNMGLIDQKEAIRRREELEKEASFYGAMDGASKFVKGDAIAGIIIVLINIIAGWAIGIVQMDMSWADALHRFSLLTIGDGIATQLPALIISVATGIIVTRSAADRELSTEIFNQLSSVPRVPLIVSIVLLGFLMLPGMPKWPLLIVAVAGFFAWRRLRHSPPAETGEESLHAGSSTSEERSAIEIRLGEQLAARWNGEEAVLLDRIASLRRQFEQDLGFAFPKVRLRAHPALGDHGYEIKLHGSRFASGELWPDRLLAIGERKLDPGIAGIEVSDPAFGLPALWIAPAAGDGASLAGFRVIDPMTVLVTHFGDVVQNEMPLLLSRQSVTAILDGVRERQPGLIEDLIPNLTTVSDIQKVLQNLIGEGVSIGNADLILEHLADLVRHQKDPVELTEMIRQRMGFAICYQLRGPHDDLAVLNLDPRVENQILTGLGSAAPGTLPVEPRQAEALIRRLANLSDAMHREGRAPVLLCAQELRRHLRAFTRRTLPRLSILSVGEIPMRINLRSFDVVSLESPA